jgi:CubicO group peptidase (beta-lactamase class C family)
LAGTAGDFLKFLRTILNGGAPILRSATVVEMNRVQVPPPLQTEPGFGFGYGWSILVDPAAAKTPQSPGTIAWGGVYGHTWFVDPQRKLTVVAFTNTTPAGLFGAFPSGVRDAVYSTRK